MKHKSEFAQILDQKVYGVSFGYVADQGRVTQAARESTKVKAAAKAAEVNVDWLSKIFFSQGPLRAQVFSAYNEALKNEDPKQPSVNQAKMRTPKPEKVAPPVAVTQPRVKRRLTFDQALALRVFTKFGKIEINEFSTDTEIKMAYRQLAKRFHPDAGAATDENFKLISKAYQKIMN